MREGGDVFWRGHERIPSIAASIYDIVISLVEPVGEVVLAEVFPDIFGRVKFWRIGRQGYSRNIIRNLQLLAAVPAGAVENERGMGTGRNRFRDFLKVPVHRLCVGVWHDDGRPRFAFRADRAEEVGPFVAGIADRAGPAAFAGPDPGQRALLAYARLVLEPDFDGLGLGMLRQAFP